MSANFLSKVYTHASMCQKYAKLVNFHRCIRTLMLNVNKPLKSITEQTNASSTFRFTDYDCLGFDLDNTICKYKIGPMVKLEYEAIASYLITHKNYSSKHLLRPIEEDVDFLMKGLVLDFARGNVLKIDKTGKIIHSSHGTKHLSRSEIEKIYGPTSHWEVTDKFSRDVLCTWNGPLSEKMRSLLDYFDLPSGLAFARAVDSLDEVSPKPPKEYKIWPDLLAALIDMYDFSHFGLDRGGYFPKIKSEPERYIQKCSGELLEWLRALKAQKKLLFLITGSHVDFASFTASTCMGQNWAELFDVVIFFSKKPGFFTDNRPFLSVQNDRVEKLQRGQWYLQGNWKDLYSFLGRASGKSEPRVAYVGDNLIQDVYTPSVYTNCDTVAVVEELQAEGAFGFEPQHKHAPYLRSDRWGSFFAGDNEELNIWLNIIREHSKLCVPDMDYIASKGVDHEYFN